jgi:TetR/AcrR family transcriptional regulator, transcriptional repressor of bet genes
MNQESGHRQQPAERRQNLIEATERALARHGAGGVSVRAIAAEADVSPGLVTHHFDGVEPLMAATYKYIAASVSVELEAAVEAAGSDPRARLLAYITTYFRPPVLEPRQLGAWLGLMGLTRSMPMVEAAHRKAYAKLRDRMSELLAACEVKRDLRTEAMAMHALIEGLWLQLSLDHGQIGVEEARDTATAWILDRIC